MSVSLYRSIAGQYEHLRSVSTVSMMNMISHKIEDQVINHRMPVNFFAGFQRFSLFPDQMRRYQKLGAVCRRVYVFGVPDVRPTSIPGVEFIPLDPTSPLAKEWFVLVDTEDFWTILATQETEGRDVQGGRAFDGLWTFDHEVVERASLLMSQTMNSFYQPIKQRNYDNQNVHISEISSRMIGRLENEKIRGIRRYSQVSAMQQIATKLVINRDVQQLSQEIAQVITNAMSASGTVISIMDENQLVVAAAEGEVSVSSGTPHAGTGPGPQSMQQGQIVYIPDLRQSFDRDPYLPTAQSVMAVPIRGMNNIYGTIVASGNQPNFWTEDDGRTVMALASMLATGIEGSHGGSNGANGGVNPEQWQAPMAYLLSLLQKLRQENALSPQQTEVMDQIDRLSVGLAQAIGVPEGTIRRILNGHQ